MIEELIKRSVFSLLFLAVAVGSVFWNTKTGSYIPGPAHCRKPPGKCDSPQCVEKGRAHLLFWWLYSKDSIDLDSGKRVRSHLLSFSGSPFLYLPMPSSGERPPLLLASSAFLIRMDTRRLPPRVVRSSTYLLSYFLTFFVADYYYSILTFSI